MKQAHYMNFTRLDEAETEIVVGYHYTPGRPAFTPRGEYAPIDPPEGPEVEIIGAWPAEPRAGVGKTPALTLTAEEEAKFRDRIAEDHEEPGRDDD